MQVEAVSEPQADSRRVHFPTFCTAVPPIDRVNGSDEHQQAVVEALERVKAALQKLEPADLVPLRDFLLLLQDSENGHQWKDLLQRSLPNFPASRIRQAIQHHLRDVQSFCASGTTPHTDQWLNDLVASTIRYQLRRLLNPQPPKISSNDAGFEQRSIDFSDIASHVLADHALVEGGHYNSLVVRALMCIQPFLGSPLPVEFFTNPSSHHEINARQLGPCGLTEDLNGCLRDLQQAMDMTAAASAARFLVAFLDHKVVRDEVERLGGWSGVETLATILFRWELASPLVLLSNVDALHLQLRQLLPTWEATGLAAQRGINAFSQRFRLTTKSARILKTYPQIDVVRERLEEVWTFPVL